MAAPSAVGEKRASVRLDEICERYKRRVTKHSRHAYTWRCPFCAFVNIGPGYRAQDRTPPEDTRRRVARRERASEQAAAAAAAQDQAGSGSPRPAPAPVRRKRTGATTGSEDAPRGSTPRAPAARAEPAREGRQPAAPQGGPSQPSRRGLFDRLLGYGEEDE